MKTGLLLLSAGLLLAAALIAAARLSPAEEKGALYVADEVPTFVDLNAGESFRFRLASGEVRVVRLDAVRLIERSPYDYGVEADVTVDGHPLRLARWFASAKAFTPPTAVNGMRIALEIASAVDAHFKDYENEKVAYWTVLKKDARLLVNDLTLPLWPDVRPLWDDEDLQLTADEIAYRTHTFYGRRDHDTGSAPGAMGRLHNDLDIAFAVGTPHYAPLRGTVGFVAPISMGVDSRPLGRERKVYQVQTGHISRAFKQEGDAVDAGEKFALSGDKAAGSIAHTHLSMVVGTDDPQGPPPFVWSMEYRHINPWWLVWQGFENERARRKLACARMGPLSSAKAGGAVTFSSRGSEGQVFRWDFGDGAESSERNPQHIYDGPGIYEVRLEVSDKTSRHSVSQFVTVDGPDTTPPAVRKVAFEVRAGDPRDFTVTFSEAVDVKPGADPAEFRLEGGPPVKSVDRRAGSESVVRLSGPDKEEGKTYRLAVSGVKDLAGNPIRPGTVVEITAPRHAVLEARADAQVYDHKNFAKTNFGAEPTMALHAGRGHFDPWPNFGGNKSGLVRFERPAGKVTGAVLRIWVAHEVPNAICVLGVTDAAWDEKTVTFATASNFYRPRPIGAVEARPEGWCELDVSDYVLERLRAGAAGIDFGLRAAACDTADIVIDTREGKHPPRLVVQYVP